MNKPKSKMGKNEGKKQEAANRKLYKVRTGLLCSLVNTMGAQYGMNCEITDGISYDYDGKDDYVKIEYEVGCEVLGCSCRCAQLTSADLITDVDLLGRILRCIAQEDGLATGAEYTEVADYFMEGKYVQTNYRMADILYNRAVKLRYHPAIIKLFAHSCKPYQWEKDRYTNWDTIFKNYKIAIRKGMTVAEFLTLDPYILHVVAVENKAADNDPKAIREIADQFQKQHEGAVSIKYMTRLAKIDEEDGVLFMSRRSFDRQGNIRMKSEGLFWHLKGVKLGHGECMYRAGRIYELLGKDRPRFMSDAIRYHEMAAQKGVVEAMYRLSLIYAQEGTPCYDQQKADFYLGKAYEFGHKQAWISNLGKPKFD